MARKPLTMATVKPLRIVGGRVAGQQGGIALQLDQRSLARGRAMLDQYRDAPLEKRMSKAVLAAAKVLEGPIKQASPVSHDKDPGGLRRSVRARPYRTRTTFIEGKGWRSKASTEANVGPMGGKRGGGHGRLVIRGHRIVTRSGRDTGRRSRSNPYVDAVAARHYKRAIAEMRAHIFQRGMQENLANRVLFGRNAG